MSSKCLCAAVELGVPDILSKAPMTLADLAEASGARPDRLRQVLRVLYNLGIFSYDPTTDSFSNNHTSTLLLSTHWTQWHNWVDLYGNVFYDMARSIPAQVKKNETRMAGQIEFKTDMDMFSYFNSQGWLPRLHQTLGGGAIAQAPGILADYPWETVANGTVMDVGGGGGALIALLLRKYKTMTGAVLDLKSVIEHARTLFHSPDGQFADVGDRLPKENLIAGDFLKEIPTFEVYTMKWCLHDWDDSKSLTILTNIRKAIALGPKSRLIVLESMLRDGRMGRLSRYGDITMMISANGQERTEQDWRRLASQTGWEITNIYQLRDAWPCAIEMIPA
jgi:gliotoxin/aspirochlorine biosynthesis O-methyltransferase